ncbi:MAG: histidine kinase, partial [Micropruina sp.]
MSAPSYQADPRLVPLVLLSLAVVAFGLSLWATLATPHQTNVIGVVRETLFVLSWIVVGAFAVWLGRTRIASRILTLALVLSLNFAGSFGLLSDAPYARLIETFTAALVPLQLPVVGHLLLSYPSGRLDGTIPRRIVTAGYAVGGFEAILWALGHRAANCPDCAVSFTYIGLPVWLTRPLTTAIAAGWLVLAALLLWQLARQFRAAGPRQRKLLRLPYAVMALTVLLFAGLVPVAASRGVSPWGLGLATLLAMQVLALLGVPLSFLIGLVRERLSHKRIGEFVVASVAKPDTDLEQALATALGDPGLTVAFPVEGGFVDARGASVPEPTATAITEVTVVGDPGAPFALITHDRSLADEPALLTAAGSATRLLLENARLHPAVRAQLLEVRESRSRIVEAANDARVRLERDLHDGAQQRILAIGIALNMLADQGDDAEVLANAKEEVAGALAELRALSAGIHPSVLTDFGLLPALDALARRMGSLVRVHTPTGDLARMAPSVEAAAYFSTAEASAT